MVYPLSPFENDNSRNPLLAITIQRLNTALNITELIWPQEAYISDCLS